MIDVVVIVRIEMLQNVVWSYGGHDYDRESTALVLLFSSPISRLRGRIFEIESYLSSSLAIR